MLRQLARLLVLGADDVNDRKAELRLEELDVIAVLQTQRARTAVGLQHFRGGIASDHHQRQPERVMQPDFQPRAFGREGELLQHRQPAAGQCDGFLIGEAARRVARRGQEMLGGSPPVARGFIQNGQRRGDRRALLAVKPLSASATVARARHGASDEAAHRAHSDKARVQIGNARSA